MINTNLTRQINVSLSDLKNLRYEPNALKNIISPQSNEYTLGICPKPCFAKIDLQQIAFENKLKNIDILNDKDGVYEIIEHYKKDLTPNEHTQSKADLLTLYNKTNKKYSTFFNRLEEIIINGKEEDLNYIDEHINPKLLEIQKIFRKNDNLENVIKKSKSHKETTLTLEDEINSIKDINSISETAFKIESLKTTNPNEYNRLNSILMEKLMTL